MKNKDIKLLLVNIENEINIDFIPVIKWNECWDYESAFLLFVLIH